MMSPMTDVPLSQGRGNGQSQGPGQGQGLGAAQGPASLQGGGQKWYEADPHQRGVAANLKEAAEKEAKRKARFRLLLGVGAACFWCGCVAALGALFGWLWCLVPLTATAAFLFLRQKGVFSNNVAVALAGASAVVPLVVLPVLFYVVGFDVSHTSRSDGQVLCSFLLCSALLCCALLFPTTRTCHTPREPHSRANT